MALDVGIWIFRFLSTDVVMLTSALFSCYHPVRQYWNSVMFLILMRTDVVWAFGNRHCMSAQWTRTTILSTIAVVDFWICSVWWLTWCFLGSRQHSSPIIAARKNHFFRHLTFSKNISKSVSFVACKIMSSEDSPSDSADQHHENSLTPVARRLFSSPIHPNPPASKFSVVVFVRNV
jgi:lysylphosphatidylglycerol synthetase-like protein (DUF2156 family)